MSLQGILNVLKLSRLTPHTYNCLFGSLLVIGWLKQSISFFPSLSPALSCFSPAASSLFTSSGAYPFVVRKFNSQNQKKIIQLFFWANKLYQLSMRLNKHWRQHEVDGERTGQGVQG